jgi:hypothetical protein
MSSYIGLRLAALGTWLLLVSTILTTAGILSPSIALAQQNVVIIIDDSGSMATRMQSNSRISRMTAAQDALIKVLRDVPDDAQVGVLALNSRGEAGNWVIPMGPLDRSDVEQRINSINADGGTPLGAAMQAALNTLLLSRQRQMYGTYRMLIVTDGEAGDPDLVERYVPIARSRGFILDVIGVDMPGDHSLATKATSYRSADDEASLATAIADVFAETTDDSGDAGQSDYDMLAPLPAEIAAAALTTLSQIDNTLVDVDAAEADAAMANSGSFSPPPPVPASGQTAQGSGSSVLGIVCMFMLFVFVALPIIIFQSIKKAR